MSLPEPSTARGTSALRALLSQPSRALIALDYDGTLAPVVDRPEDAVPEPGALDAVTRLSTRVGQLVIVSGRAAAAVVALGGLAEVKGLVVLGQYGAERWSAGHVTAELPLPGIALARARLPPLLVGEGGQMEDKGLSLVVHTRRAKDPGGALVRLYAPVAELATAAGLEVHTGRLVLELRPPGHDKGRALRRFLRDRSAVLFAGDDRGDLAAFDEVDRQRGGGVPGLLVCSDSDEGPHELRVRADLVVAGPAGVVALLQALAEALDPG